MAFFSHLTAPITTPLHLKTSLLYTHMSGPLHHEQQASGYIPDFALLNIQSLVNLSQTQNCIQAQHPHDVALIAQSMQCQPASVSEHHDGSVTVPLPRCDLCSEDCGNDLFSTCSLFLHHAMEALHEQQ